MMKIHTADTSEIKPKFDPKVGGNGIENGADGGIPRKGVKCVRKVNNQNVSAIGEDDAVTDAIADEGGKQGKKRN